MQPATNPEDLRGILSRFNHWSGKQPGNGNGHGIGEGVREIPYEEALRRAKEQQAGERPAATASHAAEVQVAAAPPVQPNPEPAATLATTPGNGAKPRTANGPAAVKARPTEQPGQSVRPAVGKRRVPAKAGAATEKAAAKASGVQPKRPGQRTATQPAKPAASAKTQTAKPKFKQVLVKAMEPAKQTVRTAKATHRERELRVSVRLTRTEEQQVQEAAAREGMTVSAYLRGCALGKCAPDVEQATRKAESSESRSKNDLFAAAGPIGPAVREKASASDGWLARLRERFLSSPVRFSERA